MKDFFEELFKYNSTVNENIIQLMSINNKIPLRATQLMSHIMLVHDSWDNRILGKTGLSDFWTEIPLNEMLTKNFRLHEVINDILANNELNVSFQYKNSKGSEFTNTVQDVLFHIVNHSTHHRGQINFLLRNAGIEPVVLDFIFYKR